MSQTPPPAWNLADTKSPRRKDWTLTRAEVMVPSPWAAASVKRIIFLYRSPGPPPWVGS